MKKIYRFLSHITFGDLSLYFRCLYEGKKKCEKNNIFVYEPDGKYHRVKKIRGIKINFWGSNSCIRIYKPYEFNGCEFNVGDNNEIIIGKFSHINDLKIPVKMSDNSKLFIGDNFSSVSVSIYLNDEPERIVKIGNDCLFSFGIIIWPSDGHTITDLDGNVLNNPENIQIGNHVWVGMNTTILKGAKVPDGSVIGARSLYTSSSNIKTDKPCIFVGSPAKVIKQGNINWDTYNTYVYKKLKKADTKDI